MPLHPKLAYLNSIQAMGAGTGVRAIRHRRTAREAMLSAYRAVPCWVMPEWRICETIPPELGLFELVVIDEASQSDIWALPALLRGKKLLVVGDHKQVSPSAVFNKFPGHILFNVSASAPTESVAIMLLAFPATSLADDLLNDIPISTLANGQVNMAGSAAAVPEPFSVLLLLTAVLLISAGRKLRRQA